MKLISTLFILLSALFNIIFGLIFLSPALLATFMKSSTGDLSLLGFLSSPTGILSFTLIVMGAALYFASHALNQLGSLLSNKQIDSFLISSPLMLIGSVGILASILVFFLSDKNLWLAGQLLLSSVLCLFWCFKQTNT